MSEVEAVSHLAAIRQRCKQSSDWHSGKEAALQLTRIRGSFGDWCWLAWFAHRTASLDEALEAVNSALSMNPTQPDAVQLRGAIIDELSRVTNRLKSEIVPQAKTLDQRSAIGTESVKRTLRALQNVDATRKRYARQGSAPDRAAVGLLVAVTQMDTWVVKQGQEVVAAFETYEEAVDWKRRRQPE